MIEILQIFLQIVFLVSIIFYPIPNIKLISKSQKTFLDIYSVKIIILANLFFIFSLTNLNNYYLLIFLLLLSSYFILKNKQKILLKLDFTFLYILFLVFIISIALVNNLGLGWDAKFFWYMKTLTFYQGESLYNLNKLPATDYPHLGSYIWAFFWKFPFNNFEYHGRIFYIFIYIFSIFSFFEIFKVNIFEKIIYSTLTVISTFSFDLISGNQEIIIFSLSLLCSKFCYLIFNETKKINTTINIFILLLIFNIAIWIKNEGMFLIGFALLIIFFLANLNKSQKKILFFGSLLIIFFRVVIFNFLNTDLESFEFEKTFNFDNFDNLLINLKIISFYLLAYLTQLPIMLISLMVLLYNLYKYNFDRLLVFVLFYLILNILFIYGAFIFSMENVEWQVRVGLKRVMFETSGFYLITIAYLINKIQKTK